MPRATRKQIRPRAQVNVPKGAGTIGVPAAIRASASGGRAPQPYISRTPASGLTAMSSVLSELAAQARQAEAKAEAEAERARNKAEREAEKAAARAEAEIKARQDSVDRITATTVGNNFLTQIAEKSTTGEWGPAEAEEAALSILQGEGSTPMFSKTFESYAVKGLGLVAENFSKLKREEETGAYLSVARQALHDLHANYDPERFEE